MITTYDIAEKAGVSQTTVSLVLNKRPSKVQISAKTRTKVLEVAASMGYRPNGSARTMSSGRFGCAALLTSPRPHCSYIPNGLLAGIHRELAGHDMHLNLAMLSDENLTDSEFVPKILREWLADGLLIDYIKEIPDRLVELVVGNRLSAIWINARRNNDCVHPDDWEAGRFATHHVLSLGHTNIAYIDPSHGKSLVRAHYSAEDRYAGYVEAMVGAGRRARNLSTEYNVPSQDLIDFATQLLTTPDRPTAIVAYSHPEPVMIAALRLGLSVPGDLSIVTFGSDDHNLAGIPFTCMVEPNEAVGETAVRMLLEKIECPDRVLQPRTEEFVFAIGATCGSPGYAK